MASSPSNMSMLQDLPSIKDQTAFNLDRWDEVCSDPYWSKIEGRVETDRHGKVIMNPPAEFSHGGRQADFVSLIREHAPASGKVTVECPISTSEGVKVADVAWVSAKRLLKIGGRKTLSGAPEICVEVLSPSNTRGEIEEKRRLYFEAGAKEVWICDRHGHIRFFTKSAPAKEAGRSALCPAMPVKVKE